MQGAVVGERNEFGRYLDRRERRRHGDRPFAPDRELTGLCHGQLGDDPRLLGSGTSGGLGLDHRLGRHRDRDDVAVRADRDRHGDRSRRHVHPGIAGQGGIRDRG